MSKVIGRGDNQGPLPTNLPEGTSSESQPRTPTGRMLFDAVPQVWEHADRAAVILAIEAEAAATASAQAEGSLDVERLVTEAVNAWIDDDTPGLDEKEWRVGLVNAVVARLAAEKPHATLGHSSWASLDAELAEHEDD